MRRIRWFNAEWPVSLRTLAAKMRANPFREDSIEGFIVDRVRENLIEGRFIEKIAFEETSTDPFGEEHTFERLVYRNLEFVISSGFPNIELWDAPRSTQAYVSKLLEFSNFQVAIVPLSVDVIQWAKVFESAVKGKVTIDSIQVAGIELERGVTAKIVISGDKDVRDALKSIVKTRKYAMERAQLRLTMNSKSIPIQLTDTGAAKLDDAFVEEFLPALKASLPRPA
jgi:hypothetical protein